MTYCPCCSEKLLRHIRREGIYWFCQSCHQEMPNLDQLVRSRVAFGSVKAVRASQPFPVLQLKL